MKRNNSYTYVEIAGVSYLLPYGQMIADHKHGIQINKTGIFLWEQLKEDHPFEELLELLAAHYGMTDEEKEAQRPGLEKFLGTLASHGILQVHPQNFALPKYPGRFYEIAGLLLKLAGPEEAFPAAMEPFSIGEDAVTDPKQLDLVLSIQNGCPPVSPNGNTLLRNDELVVMEHVNHYILLFPTSSKILEVHLTKDGSRARFYCVPPYTDAFREELFHAIRLVFLYLAQQRQMVALHSASILYKDKAWLFAGPSGTGKSTHTGIWNSVFETPVLNGDLNLLDGKNGSPVIHGIPWCGTSGICDTATHPLGGIILLKRDDQDFVEELSENDRQLLVLQRLITPSWTEAQLLWNLKLTRQITDQSLVCRLHCTPTIPAAAAMKEYLDNL